MDGDFTLKSFNFNFLYYLILFLFIYLYTFLTDAARDWIEEGGGGGGGVVIAYRIQIYHYTVEIKKYKNVIHL